MKNLIKKLEVIKEELLKEKKSLRFFSVFFRNDKDYAVDLFVAADWIKEGHTREVVKVILDKFKKHNIKRGDRIFNVVVVSSTEKFFNQIAYSYLNDGFEEEGDKIVKIKISESSYIKAIVLHSDFDDFDMEVESLAKDENSASRQKTADVF